MRARWLWGGAAVAGAVALGLLAGGSGNAAPSAKAGEVVVYKTPTCGCCGKWVDHIKAAGFATIVHEQTDLGPIRDRLGVPFALRSCHTAVVDGYIIEGHVPADVVQRLLRERPAIVGIAVPGMPAGAPGMEGLVREHYDVIAFDQKGQTSVYESR